MIIGFKIKNIDTHLALVMISIQVILYSACSCNVNVTRKISQPQIIKDFLFFTVLQKAYSNSTDMASDISPSIYQEISDYAVIGKVSDLLDSLAEVTVKNIKPTQIHDYANQKAIFINCLAFYKSDQLDNIIAQLIKKSVRNRKTEEIRQAYKDYTFFMCLKKANHQNKMNDDISQAVYTNLSGDAFAGALGAKLDSVASNFALNIQPSKIADYDGKKAVFAECLKFYKSKELDKTIKNILAK